MLSCNCNYIKHTSLCSTAVRGAKSCTDSRAAHLYDAEYLLLMAVLHSTISPDSKPTRYKSCNSSAQPVASVESCSMVVS